MSFLKGIIGGVVGGLVGAAVWAAISYFFNYEIGIIAWGVGALVGIGMAVGSGGGEGFSTGVTAGLIAIGSVLAGKYAAIHYAVGDFVRVAESTVEITDDDVKVYIADQVVKEYTSAGKRLRWPDGMDASSAESPEDYPKDLWADVEARFKIMPTSDREATRDYLQREFKQNLAAAGADISVDAFSESFTLFDALWFFLAVGTAYKLGSGDGGGDD